MRKTPLTRGIGVLGGVVAALLTISAAVPAQAETRRPQQLSTTATSIGAELASGQTMNPEQNLQSPNGQHNLYLDGWLYVDGPSGFFNPLNEDSEDNTGKRLVMQTDGNLVEYRGNTPLWWSGTAGNAGAKAAMQSDGNVVVYSAAGKALWASGQADNSYAFQDGQVSRSGELKTDWMLHSADGKYKLVMQSDGNLVLYSPRRAIWSSGSAGNPGAHFALQSDGNQVVYSSSGAVKWTSRTSRGARVGDYNLVVHNGGNVVLYELAEGATTPRVAWQTRTGGVS